MHHIHVVGCGPRTGTTLLAELLDACFDVDVHCKHERSVFARPLKAGRIYLSKNPAGTAAMPGALRVMHDLHVVYMLRDPRDTIVSRHAADPSRYWAGLSFWRHLRPFGEALQAHPRFITIRYEDLVRNPDGVQSELAARLPFLVKTAPFTQFSDWATPSNSALLALGGVRPISPDRIGQWRHHLPRVAGQIAQHGSISEDLIQYGYESDRSWEALIEGIMPDLTPSYWPEDWPRINRPLPQRGGRT